MRFLRLHPPSHSILLLTHALERGTSSRILHQLISSKNVPAALAVGAVEEWEGKKLVAFEWIYSLQVNKWLADWSLIPDAVARVAPSIKYLCCLLYPRTTHRGLQNVVHSIKGWRDRLMLHDVKNMAARNQGIWLQYLNMSRHQDTMTSKHQGSNNSPSIYPSPAVKWCCRQVEEIQGWIILKIWNCKEYAYITNTLFTTLSKRTQYNTSGYCS